MGIDKKIFVKIAMMFWIFYFPFNLLGLSYESISNGYFAIIHVLTVNPKEHLIVPVKASKNSSRETVATLANRYGAIAAINGGFWKSNGNPAGILKIDYHWYGTPIKLRGAIGWMEEGQKVLIDRVLTNYDLEEAQDKNLIEVIPGSEPPHSLSEEWKDLQHIVGGTPILIRNGHIIEDYSPEQNLESFLVKRHPRTAVGINDNGEWVFVVVDGRYLGFLGGMTMHELAYLMFDLGCIEAINLCGGASSTMFIGGAVINDPCGNFLENEKSVEAVSDAILIFHRF